MEVTVSFYSYLKDVTGVERTSQQLPNGATLKELRRALTARYPGLAQFEQSTLSAVGVDYQNGDYVLQPGDQVALFPPVQGG